MIDTKISNSNLISNENNPDKMYLDQIKKILNVLDKHAPMHLIRTKMTKTGHFLRNKEIYVIRSSETLNGYTFIDYLLIQSLKSSGAP